MANGEVQSLEQTLPLDHGEAYTQPLRVLIVGAGIGGLTAALALRQQGHDVELFEQSKLAQETGAAIHLAPNANGLLRHLGLYVEDIGAVECRGITEFKPDGSLNFSIDLGHINNKMWQHPWHLVHRAHLHTALKEMVTGEKGKGRPARLHVAQRVVEADPRTGTITFEDGTAVEGDVVIGADGVNSATRRFIPGGDLKPFDSGKSAFRFLIPTETLTSDPKTAEYLKNDDHLLMWIGIDRRLVMYPCVNKTILNFVAIHPSRESAADIEGSGWQEAGSKARMLQIYESFGAGVAAILEKADEQKIKVWTLLDLEKMPSFINERLAVMGDAAHPFLPHQGQGGGQAIEDAVSLAAVLPAGTPPDAVVDRLKVYERCRYERAHNIQHFTRLAGLDADELQAQDGEKLDMQRYTGYNFGHDEWHASTAALQQHLGSLDNTIRYRGPIGFGATPGPRQPIGLHPSHHTIQSLRKTTPERLTRYTIRFRSSRTYLQTLLPPGFAFTSPATIVSASIACTTLEGMTWLGGGGYSFLGLYVHGVHYAKRDGSRVHGTYIPVLFEDLADPIITGRDELGVPKLFAEIKATTSGEGDCSISIGWRGAEFGRFEITGIAKEEQTPNGTGVPGAAGPPRPGPPPPPPEEGELVYRYVPAVGEPGKADAEYPVLIPFAKPGPTEEEKLATKSASIKWQPGDWRSLPTLQNVVQKLAEVPVYEVEKAEMVKGVGVPDLSLARRIE